MTIEINGPIIIHTSIRSDLIEYIYEPNSIFSEHKENILILARTEIIKNEIEEKIRYEQEKIKVTSFYSISKENVFNEHHQHLPLINEKELINLFYKFYYSGKINKYLNDKIPSKEILIELIIKYHNSYSYFFQCIENNYPQFRDIKHLISLIEKTIQKDGKIRIFYQNLVHLQVNFL